MIQLDEIDKILVNELQKDCKQSTKQLAQKVNLSITPTHERIKRLESNGIITSYVAIVDHEKVGKTLTAYCNVKLTKYNRTYISEFEDFVSTLNEVQEIIYLTGSSDYLLKVVFKDMSHFHDFVLNKISSLDIIAQIESSFAISVVKKVSLVQ